MNVKVERNATKGRTVEGASPRSQLKEAKAEDLISSKGLSVTSNSTREEVGLDKLSDNGSVYSYDSSPEEDELLPSAELSQSDLENVTILEDSQKIIGNWFKENSSKTLGNLENVQDAVKASFSRFFDDGIASGAGVSVENPLESFIPYLFKDSDFVKAWSEESKLSVAVVEKDFASKVPILHKAKTSFTDSLKLLYSEAQWRKTDLEKESAPILHNQAKIKSVEDAVDVVVHESCKKFNSNVLNAELKRMIKKELPSLIKRTNEKPVMYSHIMPWLADLNTKLTVNYKVFEELVSYKKELARQSGVAISFTSSFFDAMVETERSNLLETLSDEIIRKFHGQTLEIK